MRKAGFASVCGLWMALLCTHAVAQVPGPGAGCPSDAIVADVVAIDHPMVFNRIGAQNVNWMMYALRHDLIDVASGQVLDYGDKGKDAFEKALSNRESRGIALRPDLRPRPLVLRVAAGRHLYVRLTNLLVEYPWPPSPGSSNPTTGNPFNSQPNPLGGDHPMDHAAKDSPGQHKIFHIDDQVFSRHVGFHPQGLELVGGVASDSSYVGKNADSLAAPSDSREYCFFAPAEGAFLVSSPGAAFGGEGSAGNSGVGLFGAVTVQPSGAAFYRAQVTEEEMRLAAKGRKTPNGQPIVDYEARYPDDCASGGVWCREGKAGLPILNMLEKNRIVHGDVNAIVMGSGTDKNGEKDGSFVAETYPLEKQGKRNPTLPNRLEPFREFVSIYHDENAATQAFPYFFEHPELGHTLHGVRDAFMINYGSGGVGAEIIANRLQAGPMNDCLDCAYEEFFLSSFAVGDAAMLVDKPVNLSIGRCQPEFVEAHRREELGESPDPSLLQGYDDECRWNHPKRGPSLAERAYYPHDPANVHHSYIGDFVKFRNIHAGKEQHIFHLHNHQWLFNPNDDNSNYIDAQGIGPGSGYTYEIAFGGSGNRNKTVGDAIFHCHFYPHFAQGMWYMWRNHDVMETGTPLEVSKRGGEYHSEPFGLRDGKPDSGARALPDGEIVAGTPIPAVVPLPGKALPPMPEAVHVEPRASGVGSKAVLSHPNSKQRFNPGYPFWVAGVTEHDDVPAAIGHRPTTPPLDMSENAGGFDGGLPRHALAGYSEGGKDESELTRLSAKKHLKLAKPIYFAEEGTPLEQLAMKVHGNRKHSSYRYPLNGAYTAADFILNGAPPTPGAPYNEPCIDDTGNLLLKGGDGQFFGGKSADATIKVKDALAGGIEFGADSPRVYKGANIQLDVVFNKLGYHYPQQRILSLWQDVDDTLKRKRPPEPLVLRMNTFDCAMYQHTNLVPKDFYADDYQITTPTDVIGQHIHLPKWDLTSADGSANGWNYEDGTFSPGMVRERVAAINHWNRIEKEQGRPQVFPLDGSTDELLPRPHPFFGLAPHQQADCLAKWKSVGGDLDAFEKEFGAYPGVCDWLGARTTLQRWFSDPMVNSAGVHRGLGITFTHDHLGPSTHQQLGLYATMLTEPPGSRWYHNETGVELGPQTPNGPRHDGGPTSWQALITGKDRKRLNVDGDKYDDSHREFFLQFGDFQHAYQRGVYVGVDKRGVSYEYAPAAKAGPQSYRNAIHPSVRKPASSAVGSVPKAIFKYDSHCPGGEDAPRLDGAVYKVSDKPLRPCPEAISADDVGMMVVNYRNEPVAARVYNPLTQTQTAGFAGDLGYAFQSRTDRAQSQLNTQYGDTPAYPTPLTNHVLRGDPYTPILRAYAGDMIRVKVQAGAHEHEHNGSINGLTWLQGGSGFGQAPHSGWRNAQNAGLSEQFTFSARIVDYATANHQTDRMYTIDTGQDGLWSGAWGVLRSSNRRDARIDRLTTLPSNPRPAVLSTRLGQVRLNDCPIGAPVRSYHVTAVLANKVLKNSLGLKLSGAGGSAIDSRGGSLIYNPRRTAITIAMVDKDGKLTGDRQTYGYGPLHDPTAIMFVREEDLGRDGRILDGRPVEPLVLRAAAGECVQVVLHNRLPPSRNQMPDLDGYTSLSGFVRLGSSTTSEMTSFNNNHVRPSNYIGLHPQMVHYDVQSGDGSVVGVNKSSLIGPGGTYVYQWYAGLLETVASAEACPPVTRVQWQNTLDDLKVFTRNPDLRPLAQVYDPAAFSQASAWLLERNAIAGKPLDPVRAKSVNDNLLRSASKCLESVNEPNKPDTDMPAHEEAPLLAEGEVFDRMATLERRSACAADVGLRSQFAEYVSGAVRDPQAFANELTRSFLYEVAGVDDDEAASKTLDWRLPTYPDLIASWPESSEDTTRIVGLGDTACRFVPVEYGAGNLTPPDRIKQGQKAAIGALLIEPRGASWVEYGDDTAIDRQNPGSAQQNRRASRATANVTYPTRIDGRVVRRPMRDLAIIHQKGLNFRYADASAVANLAAEREDLSTSPLETAPEDAQDAGHMAINYGSEPLWFRFGLAPDAPFGRDGFAGGTQVWQAFSNRCCGNGGSVTTATAAVDEPYVPIMTAQAGMETRLRVLMPTGIGRATIFSQHGHVWQRDPYLAERVDASRLPLGGNREAWGTPSQCIGDNGLAMHLGGQESVTPLAHYDLVLPSAGGRDGVAGDYLWRDMGGFGISNGLWGVLRVLPPKVVGKVLGLRASCAQ